MGFGPSATVVRFYYPTDAFYFFQESKAQSDNIPKALIDWHTDCINSLSITAATYRDLKSAAPMSFKGEASLFSQLKSNTDSLIRNNQNKLAVASPKICGYFPELQIFLTQLKQKVGLTPGHWSDRFHCNQFIMLSIKLARAQGATFN